MNRLSGVQKVIDPNSTIWCVWTVEKIHIFWNPLLSVSYEGSAGMWWSKFPKRMIRSKKTRLWTTYNLKNCFRSGHHSWCWGFYTRNPYQQSNISGSNERYLKILDIHQRVTIRMKWYFEKISINQIPYISRTTNSKYLTS